MEPKTALNQPFCATSRGARRNKCQAGAKTARQARVRKPIQAQGNGRGARESRPPAGLEAGRGLWGAGLRPSWGPPWWRLAGGPGGLPDQAHEVEGQREGIADEHGLGGALEAEPGRAFEMATLLAGIAALGVALAAHAQLPGLGPHLQVAGQADTAIRQAQAGGETVAQGTSWVGELASLARRGTGRAIGALQVRVGLVAALLAALSRGFANPEESIIDGILGPVFQTTHPKMLPRLFRGHFSCGNAFSHRNFTCKSSG